MQLPLSVVGRTRHAIAQERGFHGDVVARRMSSAEAVDRQSKRCCRLRAKVDDQWLR
jgi:hypothetical protein